MTIATTIIFLCLGHSKAEILTVSTSAELQAALDTARTNGEDDEIHLNSGTYTTSGGPFTYGTASNDNHSITISGGWSVSNPGFQSADPNLTILDGNNLTQVLQIDANATGVDITFNIENLSIKNGYLNSGTGGAGIFANTGTSGQGSIHLTIDNCLFQNNNTSGGYSGGAIYSNCSIEINDTRFLSNYSSAYGGALCLQYDSDDGASASPIIDNCYFEDNRNPDTGGYQGSTLASNCAPIISNCTFKGRSDGVSSSGTGSCIWGWTGSHYQITNTIFSGITIKYWGSAIQVWNGNLDITNCLFANNHAGVGDPYSDSHGAVAYFHNGNPQGRTINITNCTFTGNTSTSTYTGAIDNRGAIMNLNNCIFWDNDGQSGVWNDSDGSGTITMKYCDYYDGYYGLGYQVTDGGGNINDNPLFISDDVFRLGPDSPCIDAGNNDLVPTGITTDIAGKNRFRDDPYTVDDGNGTAPIVDMGAYEFVQTARFGNLMLKNQKLILKDTEGNDVTFALSGTKTGYGAIDPCDSNFPLIEIFNYGDDAEKSALTISTKAKTDSSAGSINCYCPMKSITAKNFTLTGDMTIGQNYSPKAAVAITFDKSINLDISSQMPIKSIAVSDWLGSLTAPAVGSITAKSNSKTNRHGFVNINANVTGTVGNINTVQLAGTWNCKSVSSIASGRADSFYLTLAQEPNVKVPALGKLNVVGYFSLSRIISAGNIGAITIGKMVSSSCFAGVADACLVDVNANDGVLDLPPVLDDTFSQDAAIKSFTVKGVKGLEPPYFINSNFAAKNMDSISIAYPQHSNSGTPFGITMYNNPKSLKIKDDDGSHSWKGVDTGEAIDWLNALFNNDMEIRRD